MATRRPILIEQGSSFSLRALVEANDEPLNVLGYSARMWVFRPRRPLIPPVLCLSSDEGNEVVFEALGSITFTATAAMTAAIPAVPGRNYYYIAELITPEGHNYRLLEGRAVIVPGVPNAGA